MKLELLSIIVAINEAGRSFAFKSVISNYTWVHLLTLAHLLTVEIIT